MIKKTKTKKKNREQYLNHCVCSVTILLFSSSFKPRKVLKTNDMLRCTVSNHGYFKVYDPLLLRPKTPRSRTTYCRCVNIDNSAQRSQVPIMILLILDFQAFTDKKWRLQMSEISRVGCWIYYKSINQQLKTIYSVSSFIDIDWRRIKEGRVCVYIYKYPTAIFD